MLRAEPAFWGELPELRREAAVIAERAFSLLPSLNDRSGGLRLVWRDGAKEVFATIEKDGKLADYSAEGATKQVAGTVKSLLRWLFEPTNI